MEFWIFDVVFYVDRIIGDHFKARLQIVIENNGVILRRTPSINFAKTPSILNIYTFPCQRAYKKMKQHIFSENLRMR